MSTTVRTVRRTSSTVPTHDEEFEAWVRGLCVSPTPTDAVNVSEIEWLSDDCPGSGIGAEILEITESTEGIVVSICGRDRRLHIR
jgi:hypothetical protein